MRGKEYRADAIIFVLFVNNNLPKHARNTMNGDRMKNRIVDTSEDVPVTLKEAQALYGDVMLRFSGYYKHEFRFTGEAADGTAIIASFKGVSSIYREMVTPDTAYGLSEHWWSRVQLLRDERLLADWYEV